MVGLPLYPYAPRLAFAIGGFVTLLAAGLTLWGFPSVGLVEEESSEKPRLRGQFLAFGTAWVQGFLEGGMITFLPVYLLEIGYSEAAVSGLMGALFMGVLLFQVPAAWAADRLGRLYLVLACHAVVLWGLLALPGCTGALQLGLGLFLVGGCCAALYPLGLALLGERLPAAALGRANAWYLAINCAGSLTGPVLTGVALEWFGRSAFFGTTAAAVVLVVGGWALRRALSRKANSSSADFQASRRAA
jgi:MFS family permease